MVAQRTAEQIHWSEEAARKPSAMWGCWDCGFEDSYVRDVDKDTQHVRVRYRKCTRCGAMWETEERRISRGSFFGRAERRRMAAYRKSRYRARTCQMCQEKYMASQYIEHTQQSRAHLAVTARKQARIKARERRYQRRWMRAKREIERASRSLATCRRCGGKYELGQYKPHTHISRHAQIVRKERNARRRVDKQRQGRYNALQVAA